MSANCCHHGHDQDSEFGPLRLGMELSTMKTITCLFALVLVLGTASAQEPKPDYKIGSLQIVKPWSRATPKGASTASAYLKITNNGTAPDRLAGGSWPSAGRFERPQV